ncbi:serine/threonine-protein kinase [Myxococcus sp. RHSTA-1-4]|uniref:serine/threonine protein kinase n=1 Tax=Myxococcus sp. RHSTA-1-4 TaxID=2874601 RepID=UPI001CBE3814|nr:serine/threonine-protein kinase [Myxococcus sp. RHSTA-1-4]MBZ4414993.1 serine/threonine protein kinase [Myxococcus sp. RHSTA-1-4]
MTAAQPFGFLKPGARIDSFRVVKALGEGANGLVLLVKRRGRQFALKLARHREVSDDAAKTSQRMTRELGCLIHLEHPNIIRARAWGRFPDLIGDYSYLVLDYVDGWTLAEWLEKTRPTFKQVARVFMKLADALDYMHRQGVFHRDISLSNVLIRKDDGEPFIVDFGAGDFANARDLTEGPLPPGTNRFRAPEAVTFWNDHRLDFSARYPFQAKDDQYALAVCLYDALTDAEAAKEPEQRAARRITINSPAMGPPPAPRAVNPRVPEALSALVSRAVEHDTAKRLPTLESLRSGLEAMADNGGEEWEAPVFAPAIPAPSAPPEDEGARARARRQRAVAAAGAVVVGAAATLAWLRDAPTPREASAPGLLVPAGGPPARAPDAPPPFPAAPPAGEVPSSAPVAPAKKEAPTVSVPKPPPRPPAPKQSKPAPRPTFTPEFLAKCAGLGLAAKMQLGCPAAQVQPERERCPQEAREWMAKMGADHDLGFDLAPDVNQPGTSSGRGVYRTGRYVGRFMEDVGDFKEGWQVEGYIWTEGERVVGRYTTVFPPDGARAGTGDLLPREVPVCIVPGNRYDYGWEKSEGSKPGAVVLRTTDAARFIWDEWPQP